MEVFVGLITNNQWWRATKDNAFFEKLTSESTRIADAARSRYGKHSSFAGWYIPSEPSDALASADVPGVCKLFRGISDHCKRILDGKPVAFSPFLTGQTDAAGIEKNYTDLLTDAGVDILMLQDGVGARAWDDQLESKVRPAFRAMRSACLSAGVELWADLEVFRNVGTPDKPSFVPADAARIGRQLAAEAPFISRTIAFDCFHYMSPQRGAKQKALYDAYLAQFVDRPFFPIHGPGVIVDPSFAYYRDRSAASIAAEIRANGYSTIHYIADPSAHVDPKLVDAFHRAGLGVWLQVFGNGTYSKGDLPAAWPAWAMVTRTDLQGGTLPGFQRLCLNHPGYRAWKKKDLAAALRMAPFDGVEIAESHWPEYPGAESPAYACFCETCKRAFSKMFPGRRDLPDVIHADSDRSRTRDPQLWADWLRFRQASLTAFLDDMVNGKGGLRETSPGRAVCIWGLGLTGADAVERMRIDSGQDAGEVAAKVKPDLYCIQTHWPDWTRADLPPDYVRAYLPFVEQVRSRSAAMPLMIQTDIGSNRDMIRDRAWVERFESACASLGVPSTCLYEYFIGGWTYHETPRITAAAWKGSELELVFARRLDPGTVRAAGAFEIDAGRIGAVELDGNLVRLKLTGAGPSRRLRLTCKGVTDDSARRLFPAFPVTPAPPQSITIPAR